LVQVDRDAVSRKQEVDPVQEAEASERLTSVDFIYGGVVISFILVDAQLYCLPMGVLGL